MSNNSLNKITIFGIQLCSLFCISCTELPEQKIEEKNLNYDSNFQIYASDMGYIPEFKIVQNKFQNYFNITLLMKNRNDILILKPLLGLGPIDHSQFLVENGYYKNGVYIQDTETEGYFFSLKDAPNLNDQQIHYGITLSLPNITSHQKGAIYLFHGTIQQYYWFKDYDSSEIQRFVQAVIMHEIGHHRIWILGNGNADHTDHGDLVEDDIDTKGTCMMNVPGLSLEGKLINHANSNYSLEDFNYCKYHKVLVANANNW